MMETEWLASQDPSAMLKFVRSPALARKLRLFAYACCRRFRYMVVPEAQEALEVAARFADGLITDDERRRTRETAFHVNWASDDALRHRRGPAKSCVCNALARKSFEAAVYALRCSRHIGLLMKTDWSADAYAVDPKDGLKRLVDRSSGEREQSILHADLVRELFGNPFRRTVFASEWLTAEVVTLAQSAYDGATADRMPELAAALANAGCGDETILSHCRDGRIHPRGCWVVDSLLGKS